MIEKNFQKYLFWKKKNIFNYFRQYFFSFSNKIEVSQSCTYRFWPFAPQRRGPCWVLHKKFSFVETQSFISWPQPCLQLSYQVISSYSFYFCHLGYCFIISWPMKHSQIMKGVFFPWRVFASLHISVYCLPWEILNVYKKFTLH